MFNKKQLVENCEFETSEISINNMSSFENIQFIDIRETHELPKIERINITRIPLSELENSVHKLDSEKQKVVFCQSGIRSKQAVSILNKLNINNCFSLKEGVFEIKNIIDKRLCEEGTTEAISSK